MSAMAIHQTGDCAHWLVIPNNNVSLISASVPSPNSTVYFPDELMLTTHRLGQRAFRLLKRRPMLLVFFIALVASASAFAGSEKAIKAEQMLQEAISERYSRIAVFRDQG